MQALAVALMLAVGPGHPEPLQLDLVAARSRILVGESAKFILRWSTSRPVDVTLGYVRLQLDDGTGFRAWGEAAFGSSSTVYLPQRLDPGNPVSTVHVMAVSGYMETSGRGHFAFAFPRVGHYRVRARYGRDVGGLTTNEVAVEVVSPTGKDAELFEGHIREHPELLTDWVQLSGEDQLGRLLEEYPSSRYLARPRLLRWERRLRPVVSRAALQRPGSRELGADDAHLLERMATEVLEDSPFDEDRLLLLIETRRSLGLTKEVQEATSELLAKYPEGAAAAKLIAAKAREDAGKVEEAKIIKQMEKALRELGIELPVPSPTPSPH